LQLLKSKDKVNLRYLSANTSHSTSIVAVVASSVANVGEFLAAKLLLQARSTSKLISPSNITTSNTSVAAVSAAIFVLTLPNYISIIPLAIYATLSSI
jgi:hypothetical protein